MFKVNNKDTRTTPFEHSSHLVLMFLLLTLNMYLPAGKEKTDNLHLIHLNLAPLEYSK